MIVIYHANCVDGFTAAWAVAKRHPTAILWPALHDGGMSVPPDVKGHDVIMVDFAYAREVTERLHREANGLIVLDHHKSTMEDLAGLDYCVFDLDRSGAKIAWDHFHPGQDSPFVRYVEDQDLWRFHLPHSRAVNAYIGSYPRNLEDWDYLDFSLNTSRIPDDVVSAGEAILRYQEQLIQEAMRAAREVVIAGYKVLASNAIGDFRSEIANRLAVDRPFGICWRQLPDGRFAYSLRTNANSAVKVDVTEVAKIFGGGGHPAASAFVTNTLIF